MTLLALTLTLAGATLIAANLLLFGVCKAASLADRVARWHFTPHGPSH